MPIIWGHLCEHYEHCEHGEHNAIRMIFNLPQYGFQERAAADLISNSFDSKFDATISCQSVARTRSIGYSRLQSTELIQRTQSSKSNEPAESAIDRMGKRCQLAEERRRWSGDGKTLNQAIRWIETQWTVFTGEYLEIKNLKIIRKTRK